MQAPQQAPAGAGLERPAQERKGRPRPEAAPRTMAASGIPGMKACRPAGCPRPRPSAPSTGAGIPKWKGGALGARAWGWGCPATLSSRGLGQVPNAPPAAAHYGGLGEFKSWLPFNLNLTPCPVLRALDAHARTRPTSHIFSLTGQWLGAALFWSKLELQLRAPLMSHSGAGPRTPVLWHSPQSCASVKGGEATDTI